MNAPRCIVAARVSTPGQEENGTSLESQQSAGEAKVKQMCGTVVGYCIEAGVSGSLYESRTELQTALARLERKEADCIVWYDLSRMSRDIEFIQVITRRIEEAGAQAVFCTAVYSEGSDGFLARGITGVVSHAERLKIRERTMAGKRKRAEQGVQPNRSRSPYGYQIATHRHVIANGLDPSETGKYTIVEEQAAVVRQMYDMVTVRGVSSSRIQRWLYESGIKSPSGNAHWTVDIINRMLRNPLYRGEAGHAGTRVKKGSLIGKGGQAISIQRTATPHLRVPIPAPAIISDEQWYRCQEILSHNQKRLSGNPGRRSMLSGILRCPYCGRSMQQCGGGGRKGYYRKVYRCGSIGIYPKGVRCPVRGLEMNETNRAVLEIVWNHLSDPKLLEAAMQAQRENQDKVNRADDRDATIATLRKEIAALAKREGTVVEAQLRAIEAGVSSQIYETKLGEIGRARSAKQDALNALEATVSDVTSSRVKERVKALSETAEEIRAALFAPDDEIRPADKHEVLTVLLEKVVPAKKGVFEVTWRL